MKRFLGLLAITSVVGAAVVALRLQSSAMPPPFPMPFVQVECDGTNRDCCGGTGQTAQGPREFVYRVKIPGGNHPIAVSSIEVGVHEPDVAKYGSLVMPTGWTLTIVAATRPDHQDIHSLCAAHGTVSTIDGTCPFVLRFAGPAQTSSFDLGYNFTEDYDIHDADWKSSNGNAANWTMPVGLGRGPVHSPKGP